MATLKTALAAAVFAVVAVTAPASADEKSATKGNFSSELQNREVAADSRRGGERSFADPSAHPSGPQVGELTWEQFKNWWERDFVNFWRDVGRKMEEAFDTPAARGFASGGLN